MADRPDSLKLKDSTHSTDLVNQMSLSCHAEIAGTMPKKPLAPDMPLTELQPLLNKIDQVAYSALFRKIGKYSDMGSFKADNGQIFQTNDYYEIAEGMQINNQDSLAGKFDSGVTLSIKQEDAWPTELTIADKAADLQETVHFDTTTHRISSDLVESCGVSRLRKFASQGENYRAYYFNGGTVQKSNALPELILETGEPK